MFKRKILFIVILCVCATLDVYGGFLSHWSPINTIINSEGSIVKRNSLIEGAELTIGLDDNGIMEVNLDINGDNSYNISIPIKYASVYTKDIQADDDTETQAYIIKYAGFQLTYANMNGYQCFIIDRGKNRVQFTGKKTKFYDDCWNVKKKKNGSEFRDADDVDYYFHGLLMDKRLGLL